MSADIKEPDEVRAQPAEASEPPEPPERPPSTAPVRRRRGRALAVGATVVVVAAAAAAVVVTTDAFGRTDEPTGVAAGPVSTETVRQGKLSAQISQSGTLSYAARADGSPYAAINQAAGVYTWLPTAGRTIDCGDVLYRVAGKPVVLLCGTTPAYRDLEQGDSGRDVLALNKNLVALGYAKKSEIDTDSNDYDSETAEAVENLQDDVNVSETGSLRLGSVAFLPGPLRVSAVKAQLGTGARPGEVVLQATSDDREVEVDLNASQQSEVKVGDKVRITLPDNDVTRGRVARIGTVASSSSEDDQSGDTGSGSSDAEIPIYVSLDKPKDAGTLEAAPVRVEITTAGVKDALIVPVTALLGAPGGGYAVETVDAAGAHRTIQVELGLFSNADGLVQVIGDLKAGDRVVVPTT